ncbi:MAG: Exopolyphosphatase [Sodalis sp.]|nr:MAG: Exopolyphosphatase [Sodalis sp.]
MAVAREVNGAMQVMERALACLALFAEHLQSLSPLRVMIVGTHALCEAVNAKTFLDLAAEAIPHPI